MKGNLFLIGSCSIINSIHMYYQEISYTFKDNFYLICGERHGEYAENIELPLILTE